MSTVELLRRLTLELSPAAHSSDKSIADFYKPRYDALRDAIAAFENLTAVQQRCTELLEENRRLKADGATMFTVAELRDGLARKAAGAKVPALPITIWLVKAGNKYLSHIDKTNSAVSFDSARNVALVYSAKDRAENAVRVLRDCQNVVEIGRIHVVCATVVGRP